MVTKPAEPQNGKITALEKENADMKEELHSIYGARKANNLIMSIIWAVIMYVASTLLYDLAKLGVNAIAVESNMSTTGVALFLFAVALAYLGLILYIVWTTVMGNLDAFNDEIRQGADRFRIFMNGGIKALKENPSETEEAIAELESQTPRYNQKGQKNKPEKSEPAQETLQKTNP